MLIPENHYVVGQIGICPYDNLIIINGDISENNIHICPTQLYSSIRIISWIWPKTSICKIGHSKLDSVIKAAHEDFLNRLARQIEIELAYLISIDELMTLLGNTIQIFLQLSRAMSSYDLDKARFCRQIAHRVYASSDKNKATDLYALLKCLDAMKRESKFDLNHLDRIEKLLSKIL